MMNGRIFRFADITSLRLDRLALSAIPNFQRRPIPKTIARLESCRRKDVRCGEHWSPPQSADPGFGTDAAIAVHARRSLLARRRFRQAPPRAAGWTSRGRQRAQEPPAVVVLKDIEYAAIGSDRFQDFRSS